MGYKEISLRNSKVTVIEDPVWELSFTEGSSVFSYMDKYVKQGKSVIDIGANHGQTVLYASLCGASHIHALEGSLKTAKTLLFNLSLNNLTDVVSVTNKVLYKKSHCSVPFMDDSDSRASKISLSTTNAPLVNAITFSDYMSDIPFKDLCFIKIDVEGAEEFLLEDESFLNLVNSGVGIHLSCHPFLWSSKAVEDSFKAFFTRFNLCEVVSPPNSLKDSMRHSYYEVFLI